MLPGYLNFSWLIEGKLAGHGMPESEHDLLLLKKQGLEVLVRLTCDGEAKLSPAQIEALGLEDHNVSLLDFRPPTQEQIDKALSLIQDAMARGKAVGVSCRAGKGRTGTILACYLVHQGMGAQEAIGTVRAQRPESIERNQAQAVLEYELRLRPVQC